MTDLDVMLRWYAPDNVDVVLYCDECGKPQTSVDGRQRKVLCDECKEVRKKEVSNRCNRSRGYVQYKFDDPVIDLVYAVINQAQIDRAWQRKHNGDGEALNLCDCGAEAFIQDSGVELWLAALGIGVRPSMSRQIREA